MPPDHPDPLDELLARRQDTPPLNDLHQDVWRRISLTTETAEETGILPFINGWFSRWSFAALFIISCALIGGLWAEIQASRVERRHNVQVVRSYLELIDPLLQEISTQQNTPPS